MQSLLDYGRGECAESSYLKVEDYSLINSQMGLHEVLAKLNF